jgi:hypothetical protein
MDCPQACGVAVSACGLLIDSLHYVYGLLVDHFFSYGLLISNIVDALRACLVAVGKTPRERNPQHVFP